MPRRDASWLCRPEPARPCRRRRIFLPTTTPVRCRRSSFGLAARPVAPRAAPRPVEPAAAPAAAPRGGRSLPLNWARPRWPVSSKFPSPKRKPAALTIQVKPVPAQPLMKQNLSQPPSQESMTSFQHVIQFQHWRPEDGDHKRQKSLLVREDDDDDDEEEDISMSHSRRPSDIPSQIS